jgi:hypothetical protein
LRIDIAEASSETRIGAKFGGPQRRRIGLDQDRVHCSMMTGF